MKKQIKLLVILSLIIFACDDILEEDITNDDIQITAPLNGAIIVGNTVEFSWEQIDGADDYRIQILKEIQAAVIVDSVISNTFFSYTFDTGDYKWRVRAENFAYNTSYTFPADFSVQESVDLTDQSVVLKTPSDDYYGNTPLTIFSWDRINAANFYEFELIKKLNGEQTVFFKDDLTANSITIDPTLMDEDAEYIWKVKAVNDTSETPFSERSLFIDTVAPNQPTLSVPADEATSGADTITFSWTNGTDTGNIQSTITNTLEIASDIDFNTVVHSTSTVNNSSQYEFTNLGTYYWRVKAVDAATNESDYSIVRSVTIQ